MAGLTLLLVILLSRPTAHAGWVLDGGAGRAGPVHAVDVAVVPPQAATPASAPSPPQSPAGVQATPSAGAKAAASVNCTSKPSGFSSDSLVWWGYVFMALGGVAGGLIYGITQNRGAIMPHRIPLKDDDDLPPYVKWNLGFWQDMIVGFGGGVIVYNLIPQAANETLLQQLLQDCPSTGLVAETIVRILSLSLIGGFAGISLFSEAAKRISAQAFDEVRAQSSANSRLIGEIRTGNEEEAKIRLLLNRVVDPSMGNLTLSEQEQLRQSILRAPIQVRNMVFEKCQQSLQANRILGSQDRLGGAEIRARLGQLVALLPVLEALEAAGKGEPMSVNGAAPHQDVNLHRYIAHQGFIRKQIAVGQSLLNEPISASQHLSRAEQCLTQAIALRDEPRSEALTREFWHYSLDRAFCRFRLDLESQAREDLTTPEASLWSSTLDPGIRSTNLKGFTPPPLQPDVSPSPYISTDFLAWLATIQPKFVLSESPPGTSASPQGAGASGPPSGQRDPDDPADPPGGPDPDHGS